MQLWNWGSAVLGLWCCLRFRSLRRLYLVGAPDSATAGLIGLVLRGIVAGACLLPPTLLMGSFFAGDRALARNHADGVSWLGLLYSANIAGAVVGCLISGFYLLRVYDMALATYAAVAINLAIGVVSSRSIRADSSRGR